MSLAATKAVVAELAPKGTLTAAINLSNFLLVTGKTATGDPVGVAPDMAAEVARRLGVEIAYRTYPSPGEVADAADTGAWDIGLIADEPQRAGAIAFTNAYCEIEATYLVPAGSPLKTIADVDRKGVRIAVTGRAAYGLWLDRHIRNAELVRSATLDTSYEDFVGKKLDALAGLRPRLLSDIRNVPGGRILDGRFMTVQQAIGTARRNTAAALFLAAFVEEAKASGLVARLIARHKVVGLSVAPKGATA
jgi:polar amino acid transport system substrate-binding protein